METQYSIPLTWTVCMDTQSIRFSDYHVSPMCTPTRGQLLTGLDAARNGAVNVSSGRALLRSENPTMANYFADAGYLTGVFGKWHLGANYPYRPQDRGFQESVWYPSSSIPSVPAYWERLLRRRLCPQREGETVQGLLRRRLLQRG